eukprot:360166-Chlamydomonas_euryale.AAC.4
MHTPAVSPAPLELPVSPSRRTMYLVCGLSDSQSDSLLASYNRQPLRRESDLNALLTVGAARRACVWAGEVRLPEQRDAAGGRPVQAARVPVRAARRT